MLPEKILFEDRTNYFEREGDLMRIMSKYPLGKDEERDIRFRFEENGRMGYMIQDWKEGRTEPVGHKEFFAEELYK